APRLRVDLAQRARRDASGPLGPGVRQRRQGATRSYWSESNRSDCDLLAGAEAQTGERRREGYPLSECTRATVVPHGRLEDSAEVRGSGWYYQTGFTTHASSFLCDAPSRGRCGSTSGAGDAWSRRHLDHADLYSRRSRVSARCAQAVSPARLTSARIRDAARSRQLRLLHL